MGGACSTYGERGGVYRVLVGKPEEKKPLGRPQRRWKGSIKMDFQEVEWVSMDWNDLAQDRDRWRALVNAGSIKCGVFIDWLQTGWLLRKDPVA
jgi:hypothetical protein